MISGPLGAERDAVISRMKERGLPFHFVVTATTRPKRPDEIHGKDYFFLSFDEFARMIEEDELVEYAAIYNEYKGIPKQQLREALQGGKDVVMSLDVQSAEAVRRIAPEALLIFLTVENEDQLITRLRQKKYESIDVINIHLATSRKELTRVHAFDYIIVNRDFHIDETVDVILAIIDGEHHRVNPRKITL